MWPLSSKTRSRQAIFLHDGRTWYGRTFAWRRRRWECIDSVQLPSANPWELPKELLANATARSAKRVRILVPNEIHNIQITLPDDVEPEEVHTALAHEVAMEVGIDAHTVHLAAVRASQFCMGGQDDTLLTSSFDEQQLAQYDQLCKKEGLEFEGLGPLELAALSCHARNHPDARLLLLGTQSGFYAAPGTEFVPFNIHSVAFGVEPSDDASRDAERIGRAATQFHHSGARVEIWCTQSLSEVRREQLRDAFGNDVEIQHVDLADRVTQVATHAAWQGRVGQITCGCAMVGLLKVSASPYRAGTWLFLAVLAITAIYIGLRWHTFQQQLSDTKARTQAWSELERERKRLNAEVDQLRDIQSRCVTMEQLMRHPVLPPSFEVMLKTLSTQMPPYTRILSIVDLGRNRYEIRGETRYQEGLIELNQALGMALLEYGLIVEPGQITQANDSDIQLERQFICRIYPRGGHG